MSVLSDILNDPYLTTAVAGSAIATLGSVVAVIGSYKSASKTINNCKEQLSEEVDQDKLYDIYNQLLPASRRTFGKTKKEANKLVDQVEKTLLGYIAKEVEELNGNMWAIEEIEKTRTFQETFANHNYKFLDKPETSVDYVIYRQTMEICKIMDARINRIMDA